MRNYFFPKYAKTDTLSAQDLCKKLEEEVSETEDAILAYDGSRNRMAVLAETLDVIHVCETILRRFGVGYAELEDGIAFVTLKNKLRGYYEEDNRTVNERNTVQ